MSETDNITLYTAEEHADLYKPLHVKTGNIKSLEEQWEEENEKKYKKQLEEREKMDILLSMSKEELKALKFMAYENVKQKKHHERNKFGGNYIPHSTVELQEEIKNLEDDLTLHEETSFEFQEENIKLRCEKNTLEHMVQVLAKRLYEVAYEVDLDNIYEELYGCDGMGRDWCRGEETEIKDIIAWARKKTDQDFRMKGE